MPAAYTGLQGQSCCQVLQQDTALRAALGGKLHLLTISSCISPGIVGSACV